MKKMKKSIQIDPELEKVTLLSIDEDIKQFERMLDKPASEEEIHQFLASHSYFFNSALRMFGLSPLYSKIRLGSQYEVDFAWFDTGSYGPEWRLAEIEAPSALMFTSKGEPSARLTHAVQQASDWLSWIHENLNYSRKLMPMIDYPYGYVFIGRRKDLDDVTRKVLRRMSYEHRAHLEIHTLDWFISAARSVKGIFGEIGAGWAVPLRALSHKDLANGLPEAAAEWLENPLIQEIATTMRQHRLEEREGDQLVEY